MFIVKVHGVFPSSCV